jgi:hypothetical protein
MEKITINKQTYKVGFSFRAIREFEKLSGKSITECTSTWDNLLFFYSTLKALNKDFEMDLEAFTDEMDAHPDLLAAFQTETTTDPSAGDSQSPAESKNEQQKKSLPPSTLWMLSLLLLVSPVLVPVISGIIWIWMSLKLLVRLIAKIGKKPASRS